MLANSTVFAFEVLRVKKQQTAVFLEENKRYNSESSLGAYWNTYQIKTGYFLQAFGRAQTSEVRVTSVTR